jgi:hypothetical protein
VKRDGNERHYVIISQVVTMLLMIASVIVTFYMESIGGAWKLLLVTGAGTGTVLLLRWFWWRINAWCEIAAMASSFLLAFLFFVLDRRGFALPSHVTLLATIAVTTVIWVAAAFWARPTDADVLRAFYVKARPGGPGWKAIRAQCPAVERPDPLSAAFVCWFAGLALVYGALFGSGHLLFGHMAAGVIGVVAAVIGIVLLVRFLPLLWSEE